MLKQNYELSKLLGTPGREKPLWHAKFFGRVHFVKRKKTFDLQIFSRIGKIMKTLH